MIQRIQSYWSRFRSNILKGPHILMVMVALAIGVLGGLFAVAFRELILLGQHIAWWIDPYTLDHVRSLPWWWKVAVPMCGGLVVGLIIHYFAREAKGHGVPEVMEAVVLRGGRIRPRVVIAKMIASALCISTGGSVGREGPIVQIGSSIGSSLGQWLKISDRQLRTLVGCGAAAGIAATFNAPVAGALFAVEIILGDFAVAQFSPIVISSVAATVVSRHFLGDFPAFDVPTYRLVTPFELIAYAVLGVLAGLVALAFIKALYGFEDFFERIRIYPPIKTALGGMIIGLIALRFPEVFGVGYETINVALRGDMLWQLLLILLIVKTLAVSITIGSGGSGGIFAPSLFIGAMTGGMIGAFVNLLWPGSVADSGAYALVGMGAVVAAGTHAPITAILIIFELTNDYKIIVPLMISCIIATLLAMGLKKSSIYTLKLLRRGIDINKGQSLDVLRFLHVSDVVHPVCTKVSAGAPLMSLVSKLIEYPGDSIFVVEDEVRLRGVITHEEIRPVMTSPHTYSGLLIAQDLMVEDGYAVFAPDDTLADVMKQLSHSHFVAPVVADGRLIGCIRPEDVIKRYNAEIFKRDMATGMVSNLKAGEEIVTIPGADGLGVKEVSVPPHFEGKTIAELDVRKRFNVSILMIKHRTGFEDEVEKKVPIAETMLRQGDRLLVMGTAKDLARMERGR